MFNMSEGDFNDFISETNTLSELQVRMAKIGLTIGEDFRSFINSEDFQLLPVPDKVFLIRNIYGEKALKYILLSVEHTEYLATVEAREKGLYRNVIIPREPINQRMKNVVGASLNVILDNDKVLRGSLILRNGIEQSFLLPSRTLAPQAMGTKYVTRVISQNDECNWCKERAGRKYRVDDENAYHFHDNCRCIIKPL